MFLMSFSWSATSRASRARLSTSPPLNLTAEQAWRSWHQPQGSTVRTGGAPSRFNRMGATCAPRTAPVAFAAPSQRAKPRGPQPPVPTRQSSKGAKRSAWRWAPPAKTWVVW